MLVPGNEVRLRPAEDRDFADVGALLAVLGLPTAGLQEQFPRAYAIATREDVIVGCAGLEAYDRTGLLRSVAVSPGDRNQGIGRALVRDRIVAARAVNLDAVFLLTTTAADYFSRLGFAETDRKTVPPVLSSSTEFASACPASATCLVLRL
jgi:amino-acid N-acetyltransferase